MNQSPFTEGVMVALAMAAGVTLLMSILSAVFPHQPVLLATISAITLAYSVYLSSRSPQRAGRLSSTVAIALLAVVLWLTGASLTVYLISHITAIWLVRSVYFYRSPLLSLLDAGLQLCALGVAQWAVVQSGNTFLVVWAYFLVQALYCFLPRIAQQQAKPADSESLAYNKQFERSARNAESALKVLFNR